MKIKRFFAPDIRQAIKLVRDEQGPDAVILSNRRVEGGVEIVAATDYDESLLNQSPPPSDKQAGTAGYTPAPAAPPVQTAVAAVRTGGAAGNADAALREIREEIKALRSLMEGNALDTLYAAQRAGGDMRAAAAAEITRRLMRLGVNARTAREIAADVAHATSLEHAWRAALQSWAGRLPLSGDDILNTGGVVALVGPTGVGKTTTIAKLAARYALRRGVRHIALITTDNYRVGAHEQLRIYGRLLDVPVRHAADQKELRVALQDLAGKELVLIDTAGMGSRDLRLAEQFAVLEGARPRIKTYLALAANTQTFDIEEAIDAYRAVDLAGGMLTKIDETSGLGAALDTLMRRGLPLAYVSDGQRVPEDIHPARAEDLVARCQRQRMEADKGGEDDETQLHPSQGRASINAH